jgi:hypothetical protein
MTKMTTITIAQRKKTTLDHRDCKIALILLQVHYLSSFATEEDAARAYDVAARIQNGPHARCNFHEPPQMQPPTQMNNFSAVAGLVVSKNDTGDNGISVATKPPSDYLCIASSSSPPSTPEPPGPEPKQGVPAPDNADKAKTTAPCTSTHAISSNGVVATDVELNFESSE